MTSVTKRYLKILFGLLILVNAGSSLEGHCDDNDHCPSNKCCVNGTCYNWDWAQSPAGCRSCFNDEACTDGKCCDMELKPGMAVPEGICKKSC